MREIKFRAFQQNMPLIKMWYWEAGEVEFDLAKNLLRKDVIVMQYTGLKDKNGKEIYEGDIVKVLTEQIDHYELFCNREVEFATGTFRLDTAEPLYEYLDEEKDFAVCTFEVIGNIHEHPNLLEEK